MGVVRTLWDRLAAARASGRTLDRAKAELAIERAFPDLKDKRREIKAADGTVTDSHVRNIEAMWQALDRRQR